MTTSRAIFFSAILTLGWPSTRAMAATGWGPNWSFGPVSPTASNHLTYVKTTFVPGRIPSLGSAGPLALWPGISNPTSNLIQTVITVQTNNGNASHCGATANQWCVEASVYTGSQTSGTPAAIDPDDHVTIEYKLESDNNTWTQTVTSQKLGKVVSTLQSKSGTMPGGGLGFASEAQGDSYTIDTQYYLCTEAHLAAADPQFGATGVGANGTQIGATGTGSGPATAKNLHTPDNGLTWLVDLITIPAMNPQGTQTPPPSYNCSASTGTGGSTGSGGGIGTGGNSGSGGSTRLDGGAGSGGSTRSDASSGSGGSGGNTLLDGSAGSGGSTRSDASIGSGGNIGSGGSAAGGTTGSNGGAVGSGGSVAAGSGGTTGAGGINGTGGANQGSGGSLVAASGGTSWVAVGTGGANQGSGGSLVAASGGTAGSTGKGSATGTSATGGSASTAAGSAGCGCVVGSQSPRGGMSVFLLLVALALLARRRRNRT